MGSKKRSTWAKEKAKFNAALNEFDSFDSSFDDVFAREDARRAQADAGRDSDRAAEKKRKACESKNRYDTLAEAQENLAWCESRGTQGLQVYECPYCGGWHLTSHPWE